MLVRERVKCQLAKGMLEESDHIWMFYNIYIYIK